MMKGKGKAGLLYSLCIGLVLLSIFTARISFACLSYGSPTNFPTGGSYPYSVAIGDLNGDGKLDLVAANYSSNNVSIFLGNGDGTFTAASTATVTVGTNPVSVAIGDLNGDGNADLAVANYGDNNVSIFKGNGDGTFTEVSGSPFSVGTGPYSVAIGNLDAGSIPDLAVANYGSNDVSILLGNGDGTVTAASPATVTAGTGPVSVAIGNLDGGSNSDLAVANYGSNNVSILLGNGDGTFGSATNFAVGSNPYAVAIGDLDGDTKPDLAVANGGSNNVSILLGNGSGSFGSATNFPVGNTPTSVAIGDLDGDGNLDLVTANYGATTVSILRGNGTGAFAAAVNLAAGTGPASVAIGDLNADTKPDLVAVNHTSNNVSILLNQQCPDLTMTAVTPHASTANQGGTLSVTDTVANLGLADSGTFRIGYYFSLSSVGITHDVSISTIRTVTTLGAGDSNNATTILSIPSTAPGGTYYVCAMADSVNQVAETNELNNTLCGATVTLPKADLLMTGVTTDTTVIAPGKTLALSNSVKNQGGFNAGTFKIGFYLSVNHDGSTQDVAITATRTLSALAAGATSTAKTTLTIPSTALLGTYYVCANADSLGQVDESDEGNNTLCTGSTIQVTLPDLSMTDVTPGDTTATKGKTLSVATTVSNGGSASGAFRIAFYLSSDGVSHDVVITTPRVVFSLAAGASSTEPKTILTIPGATPSGAYYVCTLADSLDQVTETNEGNNTLCSGFQVNVP